MCNEVLCISSFLVKKKKRISLQLILRVKMMLYSAQKEQYLLNLSINIPWRESRSSFFRGIFISPLAECVHSLRTQPGVLCVCVCKLELSSQPALFNWPTFHLPSISRPHMQTHTVCLTRCTRIYQQTALASTIHNINVPMIKHQLCFGATEYTFMGYVSTPDPEYKNTKYDLGQQNTLNNRQNIFIQCVCVDIFIYFLLCTVVDGILLWCEDEVLIPDELKVIFLISPLKSNIYLTITNYDIDKALFSHQHLNVWINEWEWPTAISRVSKDQKQKKTFSEPEGKLECYTDVDICCSMQLTHCCNDTLGTLL